MKNKNNIKEDMSYPTSSSDTSSSTQSQNSSNGSGGATINVKKKDLSDPSLQKNISGMKNAQVNVIDEDTAEVGQQPARLIYLSNVKDATTGEISKPFSINAKTYQMVRAITPDNKKVLGVYSHDDPEDEHGPIIHDVEYFEKNIAGPAKAQQEQAQVPQEQPQQDVPAEDPSDAPVPVTQDAGHGLEEEESIEAAPAQAVVSPEAKEDMKRFAGYRHFIVNKKNGKVRKFKLPSELAGATMSEEEKYMGLKEFKKYIDEELFGGRKQVMKEDTPVDPTIIASSQKLMGLIQQKIPKEVITNIQNNPVAQAQVIIDFAQLIGVPSSQLQKITIGLRNAQTNSSSSTSNDASSSTTSSTTSTATEGRKVVKTIKIKDLK